MRIDAAIQSYMHPAIQKESRINSPRPDSDSKNSNNESPSRINPKDIVEISSENQSRLAKIQERIQSGFYNTEQVDEDISDKLSKLFDDAVN